MFDSPYLTLALSLLSGCGVFLAWIGYGHALVRLLGISRAPHWGVLALVGVSVVLFLGGVQAGLHVVSPTANVFITAAGVLLFLHYVRHARSPSPPGGSGETRAPEPPATLLRALVSLVRILALAVIAAHLLGTVLPYWRDNNDDWLAYYHFPRMMLETGTLLEPFNFRRLGSLGGSSYLGTLLYPLLRTSALPFTDVGMGTLLLWAAALGFFHERRKALSSYALRREAFALLAVVVSASAVLYNHAPVVVPLALFVGLFWVARRQHAASSPENADAVILLVFHAVLLLAGRGSRRRTMRSVGLSCVVMLVVLTPWFALSHESSGTMLYPLFKGNYNFPGGLRMPMSLQQKANFILTSVKSAKLFEFALFAAIAAVLGPYPRFFAALFTASIVTVAGTALPLTASDTFNVYRYSLSFLLAGLVVVSGSMLMHGAGPREKSRVKQGLKVLFICLSVWWFLWPAQFYQNRAYRVHRFSLVPADNVAYRIKALAGSVGKLSAGTFSSVLRPAHSRAYEEVQESLPGDAKVLSMAVKPFLWDFTKQDIHTLDVIGQASPPPGLPVFGGPDAISRYLRGLGYEYIVYTPPESEEDNVLYNRKFWLSVFDQQRRLGRRWAPYFLYFFDYLKSMEDRGSVVFRNEYLRIIRLDAPGAHGDG
jgi:hypothetical protein